MIGDCDDVFYDKNRKRIYASGGDGAISVFEQKHSDRYTELARIKTVKGARTSSESKLTGSNGLLVPYQFLEKIDLYLSQ
jgi:hypothetical protein